MKCDMDCLKCVFSDCLNSSNVLSEEEIEFSQSYDMELKDIRREEQIRQMDNPKDRAIARYRRTPKGKAMLHRMNTNSLAKERYKRYERSEKGRQRRKRYEATPERIAYRKNYMSTYNKMYKEKLNRQKEEQRLLKLQLLMKELLLSGSIIVRGKKKNRPREFKVAEDINSILEQSSCEWKVRYNEENGSVYLCEKGEENGNHKDKQTSSIKS